MATAFQMSYNGLVFGPGGAAGLGSITRVTGLNDMPPIRSTDADKAGDHGAFAGVDLLSGRIVELELFIGPTTQTGYDALCDQVQAAFAVSSVERALAYTLGDTSSVRQIFCRPRRCIVPRDPNRAGLSGIAAMSLFASDPRKYAITPTVLTTGLAAVSGGMTFNATFPLSFGATGGGGTVVATNAGNFQTPITLTITGPVTNPIIDNQTTGQSLAFLITLSASDTLVISGLGTSACSIVLNGTASRRNTLQAGSAPLFQFGLPGGIPGSCTPGTSQTFRFRNNGAFAAGTLQMTYSSAWI